MDERTNPPTTSAVVEAIPKNKSKLQRALRETS
jgi:hypothetical protein